MSVSSYIPRTTLERSLAGRRLAVWRYALRLSRLAAGLAVAFTVLLAAASGAPVAAQGHTLAVSAAGVVGGAFGTDGEDPGLDQTGFQLGFSWDTLEDTQVSVRAARVAFSDEQVEGLFDPELTFVTIAGEYQFNESFYRSGLYLGLGFYQLEGLVGLESQDDSSLGLTLGATGDFPMTNNLSILIEIAGHYADLELGPQLYGFLSAGLAFHF